MSKSFENPSGDANSFAFFTPILDVKMIIAFVASTFFPSEPVIAITVGAVTIKHVSRNPEVLKKVAEGGKKINDALDAKIQQLENDITTM